MTCDDCSAELDPEKIVYRHTSNGTRRIALCADHAPVAKRRDPALTRWFAQHGVDLAEILVAKRKA